MCSAGIPLSQVIGSETSCFVGGFTRGRNYLPSEVQALTWISEYDSLTSEELADTLLYTTTGNGLTMMSNRLSWFYDLRGRWSSIPLRVLANVPSRPITVARYGLLELAGRIVRAVSLLMISLTDLSGTLHAKPSALPRLKVDRRSWRVPISFWSQIK